MTIAIADVVAIGTDETTGATIANNATSTSGELDLAGAADTLVEVDVFLKFTSTVTAGLLVVTLQPRRATGGGDFGDASPLVFSAPPINGTRRVWLGRVSLNARYATVAVLNSATGANATNVFVNLKVARIS